MFTGDYEHIIEQFIFTFKYCTKQYYTYLVPTLTYTYIFKFFSAYTYKLIKILMIEFCKTFGYINFFPLVSTILKYVIFM